MVAQEWHGVALLITLLTESLGMVIFCLFFKEKFLFQKVTVTIITNLITHTLFWYTLPLIKGNSIIKLYSYELIIVVVEGQFYQIVSKIPSWQANILSAVLNLISFGSGIYIWNLIGKA